ncbi:hypothetical protein [Sphingopyxis sp. EG6]|uniref:hypothetical protein n=1 Tax=Sphingopyxis sp. EG6 TaxID=1874061 RepID=UPI000DC613CB|nr:hypothetical protein [Sphingopyxis sp. EG6]BBB10574.1 hypothetical protein SPYCW_3590 [Sphingopyxis sp. EG6]
MTEFTFDAATFVAHGHELDPGEYSDEMRKEIAALRKFYPELSHWGDLAFGSAFGDMSQDVLSVGWANWLFDERHDFFLDYCCWRQTRGVWDGGMSEELQKAREWRSDREGSSST